MMYDSESDIDTQNSVFTFPSQSTSVSAKGPNINRNLTNLSFRNNMFTSTNMPWTFDKPRYAESVYDQRSMYSRREISPMSIYSASEMQRRNMHNSFYSRGIGSQRSLCNGRGGSPFSIRTVDSNTSVSAIDIAAAFKTMNFNKYELRVIKDAYNKYMKNRIRKRIEKRRNLRMFMRSARRKSGGDSGEQGSDSSLSSDDCRSTRSYKSAVYKENSILSGCRSTRADLMDFKKTIQESNMYRDCTNNFKQNSLKNVFPTGPKSFIETTIDKAHSKLPKVQNQLPRLQNETMISQKERFTNGFLLPSQRFNQSILMPISEKPFNSLKCDNSKSLNDKQNAYVQKTGNNLLSGTESEQEEIFSKTITEKHLQITEKTKNKRTLEDHDTCESQNKRTKKLSTPQKRTMSKGPPPKLSRTLPKTDFIFAKPQFPVKKLTNKNQCIPKIQMSSIQSLEKTCSPTKTQTSKSIPLLAQNTHTENQTANTDQTSVKSNEKINSKTHSSNAIKSKPQALPEIIISPSGQNVSHNKPREQLLAKSSQPLDTDAYEQLDKDQNICESSNMSVRPSFIKRKLFSQKVDLTDNRDASSDSIKENSSPSDVYSEIQKEKNRTRKLVTNQSCLSRDVLADDSNLLDLIQKMVPPDQMNITTAINRKSEMNIKSKLKNDKSWKVQDVIASCSNTDEMSDTCTDEEIFKCDQTRKKQIITKNNITEDKAAKNNQKKADVAIKENFGKQKEIIINCEDIVKKIALQTNNKSVPMNDSSGAQVKSHGFAKTLYQCVKSFWDTDMESDVEHQKTPLKLSQPLQNPNHVPFSVIDSSKDKRPTEKSLKEKANVLLIKHASTVKPSDTTITKEKNNNKPSKTINLEKPNSNVPLDSIVHKPKNTKVNNKKTDAKPNKNDGNKPKQSAKKITLDNNLSQNKLQAVTSTLKVSASCKPKVKLCCGDSKKVNQSFDESTDTVYRNLRGRKINITSSFSDCSPLPTKHKIIKKKNFSKLSKDRNDSQSDLSFTLISSKVTTKKNGINIAGTRQSERLNRTKTIHNDSEISNNSSSVKRSSRMNLRAPANNPNKAIKDKIK